MEDGPGNLLTVIGRLYKDNENELILIKLNTIFYEDVIHAYCCLYRQLSDDEL